MLAKVVAAVSCLLACLLLGELLGAGSHHIKRDDAGTDNIQRIFQAWCQRYQKAYATEKDQSEFLYRLHVFQSNYREVQNHNDRANRGEATYYLAMNQFADITPEEYKNMYGHMLSITTKCNGSISDTPNPPAAVNWTAKGIVEAAVINEGVCAANWAISAVAAIQSLHALKLEKLVKFSEQQLIDCSNDYGNEGCGGGFMEQAYWYAIDQGLASDKSYPLVNKQQPCKYTPAMKSVSIKACAAVPSRNYDKLLSAVVQQPVTVAVDSQKFMLYERGVYTGDCGTNVDRGMLLVGYGEESTQKYWLLKNSLGPNWGEKGYIRLLRKEEEGVGMCGIQLAASVPLSVS